MRQGEIPAILDGSKQLDIVLGVTAASMAEDELRQMALELEKEAAGLDVLRERIRSVGNELTQVHAEVAAAAAEEETTAGKLAALGEAADPRKELDKQLAPLLKAVAAFEERQKQSEVAQRRLADERERLDEALKDGSKADAEKELATLDLQSEKRVKAGERVRGELEVILTENRKLHEQRGDLAGRLDRRKALPNGKDAKCEVCGAAIDAEMTKKELAQWTDQIAQLDTMLAKLQSKQSAVQESLDKADAEERTQTQRTAKLKEQRDRLTALEEKLGQRQSESVTAATAETEGYAAVQTEAKAAKVEATWTVEGDSATVIASIRDGVDSLKQTVAETVGRQLAERQALTDLMQRFDAQKQTLGRRQTDLEREHATATANAGTLEIKAARAERFRRISAAFKEYQVQVRSEASTKLAADAIALHRRLSRTDEFTSLVIDPTQYSVQVVPKELGEEVPTSLYEGGGHRLLLGLAYRLAVARLHAECPMLLLDEPTYGLDAGHREALLDRITDRELAKQVLLITHHMRPELVGNRIRLDRRDNETVVVN